MVHKLINKIKKLFVKKNRNLSIHASARIFDSVQFDTRFGGTIAIGEKTEVLNGVLVMTYGGNITIGSFCSINPYTVLYGHGGLTIGNNVLIAAHCVLIPGNHIFTDTTKPINLQGITKNGIVIEDDVWIGTGCSILDGVTIGKGAVIAAGAVVNQNVKPYTVVGGVPAKLIKERN